MAGGTSAYMPFGTVAMSTAGSGAGGRALDQLMADTDHILRNAVIGAGAMPPGGGDGSGDAAATAALLRSSPLRTQPSAMELLQVCDSFAARAGQNASTVNTRAKTYEPEEAWDVAWVGGLRRMVRESLATTDAGLRQRQMQRVHKWMVSQNSQRPGGPLPLHPAPAPVAKLFSHHDADERRTQNTRADVHTKEQFQQKQFRHAATKSAVRPRSSPAQRMGGGVQPPANAGQQRSGPLYGRTKAQAMHPRGTGAIQSGRPLSAQNRRPERYRQRDLLLSQAHREAMQRQAAAIGMNTSEAADLAVEDESSKQTAPAGQRRRPVSASMNRSGSGHEGDAAKQSGSASKPKPWSRQQQVEAELERMLRLQRDEAAVDRSTQREVENALADWSRVRARVEAESSRRLESRSFGSHGLHNPSSTALIQRHLSEASLRSLGPPLPTDLGTGKGLSPSDYGHQYPSGAGKQLQKDGSLVFSQTSIGSSGVGGSVFDEPSEEEIEHQMELAALAARESFHRRYPEAVPITDSDEDGSDDGDGVEWRISDDEYSDYEDEDEDAYGDTSDEEHDTIPTSRSTATSGHAVAATLQRPASATAVSGRTSASGSRPGSAKAGPPKADSKWRPTSAGVGSQVSRQSLSGAGYKSSSLVEAAACTALNSRPGSASSRSSRPGSAGRIAAADSGESRGQRPASASARLSSHHGVQFRPRSGLSAVESVGTSSSSVFRRPASATRRRDRVRPGSAQSEASSVVSQASSITLLSPYNQLEALDRVRTMRGGPGSRHSNMSSNAGSIRGRPQSAPIRGRPGLTVQHSKLEVARVQAEFSRRTGKTMNAAAAAAVEKALVPPEDSSHETSMQLLAPSQEKGKGLGTSHLIGGYTACGVPRIDPMEAFYEHKRKEQAKAAAAAKKAAGGGKSKKGKKGKKKKK